MIVTLVLAHQAISYFNQVPTSSSYHQESQQKKKECIYKLAKKEHSIANFYLKRKRFLSAFHRFKNVLKKYRGWGYDSKALMGIVISAHHLKEEQEAQSYFKELSTRFIGSPEWKKAKKALNHPPQNRGSSS